MAKGVAVKFKSYEETVPKILKLLKVDEEIKKYDKIVLKPNLLSENPEKVTNSIFAEQVLKFCLQNKNPVADIFIAEGCDGTDTLDTFDKHGYTRLSEKYKVGLIDLNNTETEKMEHPEFLRFESIHYPKILKESWVISLPKLNEDAENGMSGSLHNMIGAFPSKHYTGFFSSTKSKIRKHPIEYQIHDILKCKMPNLALIDASERGFILVGQPLEMDKQASKLLGKTWEAIPHLRLVEESFYNKEKEENVDSLLGKESS